MKPSDRATLAFALGLGAASGLASRRLLWPREAVAEPVAVTAEDYFSPEEIRAGRRYARPQRWLGAAGSLLDLTALAALARREQQRRRTRTGLTRPRSALNDAALAGAYGGAITVALTVTSLPLDAIARRRSLAVGLSTQSWGSWVDDLVKSTAIEAALNLALIAGSSALARRYGSRWWLVGAGGTVAVAAAAGLLAPVITDPIFNSFDPLPDGETRQDVLDLAEAAGVTVGEVFSIDASKRSTAVNAYVNGLGPTKRVVLFDNLLTNYSRDEVRFVVSHELGHVAHRDVWRLIAFLALSAPPAMLVTQQLTTAAAGRLDGPEAVPVFLLTLFAVMAPVGLGAAALSRAVERRTDAFGLGLSHTPDALISFFRQIAIQNHADVTPSGRFARLMSTHPPITERIGAALAFKRAHAPAGPAAQPGSSRRSG